MILQKPLVGIAEKGLFGGPFGIGGGVVLFPTNHCSYIICYSVPFPRKYILPRNNKFHIYVTFISLGGTGGREEMHIETMKFSFRLNIPGKRRAIYVTFISSLGGERKCTSMKTEIFTPAKSSWQMWANYCCQRTH